MARRFLLLTFLLSFSLYLSAQSSAYPRNYFRSPLNIPLSLAANFGELRPAHWHMGLDIRTEQKQNLPVYAAAEGYIAHIGIRPQSFGRFIIINHPNGLSTLYGHLNDFFPALEEYVTAQQYKKESWAIELDFGPKELPVTKGSFIAYSGNTGGSQGPHVHFEIFNTRSERRYNPLLFDLPLSDEVAPTIVKLAMYDRRRSVYDQSPVFFNLKSDDGEYRLPKNTVIRTASGKVSFAIQAYDRMTKGGSPDGIYSASLFLDDELISGFALDSLSYEETVSIDAHIDYKFRYNGGSFLQQLTPLPGDQAMAYHVRKGDGTVVLPDTAEHQVRIEVKDAFGNTSLIGFVIRRDDSLEDINPLHPSLSPMVPHKTNVLERPGFEAYLPATALYDTVQTVYFKNPSMSSFALSGAHQLNDASVPVHDDIIIRIKPDRPVPSEWQDRLLIQRSDRKGNTIRKAVWEEKWLSARFGDFGTYQLVADTIPPRLPELGKGDTIDLSPSNRIIFTPTDNFDVIRKFRAELDGHWIRFTNDKSRSWIYIFDERCPYGVHELKVSVEDLAGNVTSKSWWFKRYPYTPPPPKKKVVHKKGGKIKKKK